MKLHLGCGLHAPDGWINIDGSFTFRVAKWPVLRALVAKLSPRSALNGRVPRNILIHDVRKPLPMADHSVSAIYSSNMLEHLYLNDARRLLKECHRVLKPSGVLRIVVPDLAVIIRAYCMGQSGEENTPADLLNKQLGMYGFEPVKHPLLRLYYNLRNSDHKFLYDEGALTHYFNEAGFSDVSRCTMFESRIPDIESVERSEHFTERHDLCIEGIKA